MFTGIVAAVGRITRITPSRPPAASDVADPSSPASEASDRSDPATDRAADRGTDHAAGVRLSIDAGGLDLAQVAIGDSIAIAGACMTVVARTDTTFEVDVSRESLEKTSGLDAEGEVNLERALRFGDRLDGHLVSGHVDGTGVVARFDAVGESHRLVVHAPRTLARFIALKGSIAIDGASLTINSVEDIGDGCAFSINLIPHTLAVTTLRHLVPGRRVNLEIDTIARYVERMMSSNTTPTSGQHAANANTF